MLVPTYLHRQYLKKPLGILYKDNSIWRLKESFLNLKVITVGDMVTLSFLNNVGRTPEISIIDGKTGRKNLNALSLNSIMEKFDNTIKIRNPQGSVSLSTIYNELAEGLLGFPEEKTLIIVEGEEDLVLLSVLKIINTSEKTVILYGQPGEGVVMINIDDDMVLKASWLMQTMDQVIPPSKPPISLIGVSRDTSYGEDECRRI